MFTVTPVVFWISDISSNFQTEYINIHTFEKSHRKKDGSSLAIHQEWTVNAFPLYKEILELRHLILIWLVWGMGEPDEWRHHDGPRLSHLWLNDKAEGISPVECRLATLSKIHVCYPKLYVSTSRYAGLLCRSTLEFNIGLPNKDVI